MGGMEMRKACGRTTWRIRWKPESPTAPAASDCPLGTARMLPRTISAMWLAVKMVSPTGSAAYPGVGRKPPAVESSPRSGVSSTHGRPVAKKATARTARRIPPAQRTRRCGSPARSKRRVRQTQTAVASTSAASAARPKTAPLSTLSNQGTTRPRFERTIRSRISVASRIGGGRAADEPVRGEARHPDEDAEDRGEHDAEERDLGRVLDPDEDGVEEALRGAKVRVGDGEPRRLAQVAEVGPDPEPAQVVRRGLPEVEEEDRDEEEEDRLKGPAEDAHVPPGRRPAGSWCDGAHVDERERRGRRLGAPSRFVLAVRRGPGPGAGPPQGGGGARPPHGGGRGDGALL